MFMTWLAEKKQSGLEPSANAIDEAGWIFALDHSPAPARSQGNSVSVEGEEICELILIDSRASVQCALLNMAKRMVFDKQRERDIC